MSYSFPREIIKWLQSMDLTVSFSNIRRDLANGYIYAEVISKYHPGTVPMHTFENSHKTFYREDNWKQLSLIFNKLKFNFQPQEYNKVRNYDMDQTIEFTGKLYTKLTNRLIELKKRNTVAKIDDKTKTMLLTETGLENIDLKEKRLAMMAELEDRDMGVDNTDSYDQEANQLKNHKVSDESSNFLISRTEINKMMDNTNDHMKESQKSILSSKMNLSKRGSTFILKTKQRLVPESKNDNKTLKTRFNDISEITNSGYKPINERLNELLHKISDNYDNECFIVISDDELSYYNFSNVVNSFSEGFLRSIFYEISLIVI